MKTNKYLIGILIVLFFNSCKKDFLDVPDKRTILRQAYVTDLNTASHFVNGIYTNLAAEFYYASTLTYAEVIADNVKPIGSTVSLLPHYKWQQQADDKVFPVFNNNGVNANGLWLSGYKILRECNFVIEEIEKFRAENPAKADDLKGQSFAIRALIMFQLVNVFAQPYGFTTEATHLGVPYVKSSLYTEPVTRLTVAEVYQNMISDLMQGITLMSEKPLNVKDINRFEVMNRDAAKAILARIYLYKADYLNARQISVELATKYPLMTGANFPGKLFTRADSESLFKLTPADETVSGYNTTFSGRFYRSLKLYSATADIANNLTNSPTDVRAGWVKKNILPNGTIDYDITKFPTSVLGGIAFVDGDYYQTIVRSAEMFLIAAESYMQLGDESNAKLYLDKVRLRADQSASPTTFSGASLLAKIYEERNRELCFEGHRMFDLLRWKLGVKRTNPVSQEFSSLPYPSAKAIAPIPFLDVKQLGLQQNDEY